MSLDTFKTRNPDNVPGKFYVGDQCTDCDFCREVAPDIFARNDEHGYSYVKMQPQTAEQVELCQWAAAGCCTSTIHDDGDAFDWNALPAVPNDSHPRAEGEVARGSYLQMDHFSDLHFAAGEGDTATVESLLRQGHDPNKFDDISCTPLHYAAENGHLEVVTLLLRAGADVNAHDEARAGDTPLGRIAGNCSIEVAEALVCAGADPTIGGWMQLSALDRAKDRKRPEGRRVYELLSSAARKFTIP